MTIHNLTTDFDFLFDCNYFSDDFDPENNEEHLDFAVEFFNHYSWETIYQSFFIYLTEKCTTAQSVYNAANLFYYYGFVDNPITEPYKLVGYIMYRIDLEKTWKECGDFIDSFIITVLETCGELNLKQNPYYQPWNDDKIIKAIEDWKAVTK